MWKHFEVVGFEVSFFSQAFYSRLSFCSTQYESPGDGSRAHSVAEFVQKSPLSSSQCRRRLAPQLTPPQQQCFHSNVQIADLGIVFIISQLPA